MSRSAAAEKWVRSDRVALAAILLIFIVLGLWYSLSVPIFEKPDELFHYAFVRTLAQGNPLPVQSVEADSPWSHEGTQAPLYYFLAARLTATIDQNDFEQVSVRNPRANLGNPLFPGNKNYMLYSARPLPLEGTNLAVRVGRWFSLALGSLTIVLAFLTARLAFPAGSALPRLAALLVASVPQFAFISSSVSNDIMIVVTSTAAIYWLARLIVRNKDQAVRWWEWGVLGILLGLAALSKLQGLLLIVPTSTVILWMAWERRSLRSLLGSACLAFLPALAIAGWWYWRNFSLYGEWFGTRTLLTISGLRTEPRTWRGLVGEMRGLRYSFWALFGWFNILLPAWIYKVLDAISILALVGLGIMGLKGLLTLKRALLERSTARVLLLLALWAITLVVFMYYWSTFATSSQGRLLFPALGAFGVLTVTGLSFWTGFLPGPWRLPALMLLPAGLVGCSLYALVVVLPAVYRAPMPISSLPTGAIGSHLTFDNQVELVGITLPEGRFEPGEDVPITLYLRSPQRQADDWPLFIQLLDEKAAAIANVTTNPGWGRNPTSLWEPGALYADRYLVRISEPIDSRSPLRASVYVGFMPPNSLSPLTARNSDGVVASGVVGHVDVIPSRQPGGGEVGIAPVNVSFEDGMRLVGQRLPERIQISESQLPVTLLWEAYGAPTREHVAFVHLVDSDGGRIAGYDQPPAGGRFPTDRWQPGDRSLSEFVLSLPPNLPSGTYQLWAGLYPAESQGQVRLAITDSDRTVQNESILLGTVEVK